MATGGPNEANRVERSLPAAYADPQATFDAFGNLYLTYLGDNTHQQGKATGGGVQTLVDNSRQWVPSIWRGSLVYINPGTAAEEWGTIGDNTATELTIREAWINQPGPNTPYYITSGLGKNLVVVVYSTDGGRNFNLLKIMEAGSGEGFLVDYPAIATGPGRDVGQQSVWVAWRSGRDMILAAGAAVLGLGRIDSFFPTQVVDASGGMGLPRIQVGPSGQVMVSYHTTADPGPDVAWTRIYVNVDDDGLGSGGFRTTVLKSPGQQLS